MHINIGTMLVDIFVAEDGTISLTRLPEKPESLQELLVASKDNTEDWEDFAVNSGRHSNDYVVLEYVGKESCSQNWTTDRAEDGFTDSEIQQVLEYLDNNPY